MKSTPDKIEDLKSNYCEECGEGLTDLVHKLLSKRQEVILPPIEPIYLEYRQYGCLCPCGTPPDNNSSERAVRNFKVKQKISGQFKSGQDTFCTLRSIIDTLRKRELDVLFFLKQIMAL